MNTQFARARPLHRRYVPDLNRLLDQCERNYFTLRALLAIAPQHAVCAGRRALSVKVVEQERYTTTLLIQELGTTSQLLTGYRRFMVRMYHDARLAEVLQWHNRRIMKGSYPYPNVHMLQRDEKQRVNEFLAEWLAHCARRLLPLMYQPLPDTVNERCPLAPEPKQ